MKDEIIVHVELLLGSIGVTLGIFFAAFLLLTYKKYRISNIFLSIYLFSFSLRIGKSLFHNYFEIDPGIRTLLLSTLLAVGPATWLYVRSTMRPHENIARQEYFHFFPLLFAFTVSWTIPNDGSPIFGVF